MSTLPRFKVSSLILESTEAQFQTTLEEMASYLGWRCWHDNDSRYNEPGFPDLICVRDDIIFLECKRQSGRHAYPTHDQVSWLRSLRASGHHAYVVRPSDHEIVEDLFRGEFLNPSGPETIDSRLEHLVRYEHEAIHRPPRRRKRRTSKKAYTHPS